MNTKIDYKSAGVNIDEGNKLVQSIQDVVAQTARPGADTKLGSFGSIFDLKKLNYRDPLLISSTDGVGTKLKLAQQLNMHETVGQDLVAMCVNDILAQGAEPLFFLDYFATGKLDRGVAKTVIEGIAHGCKLSNCALTGGETAEMPGMYNPGEYDLAGFAVGIVERENLLPKKDSIQSGDMVIGLASSGPHSNGYSLIRKIIATNNISLTDAPPFASSHATLGQALLEPTHIYVPTVLPLCKQNKLKSIAHITGGGLLENVPRALPDDCAVELDTISWYRPAVFDWIQECAHIDNAEMQRTFNLGIGMTLIVDEQLVNAVMQHASAMNCRAYVIGQVIARAGDQQVIID